MWMKTIKTNTNTVKFTKYIILFSFGNLLKVYFTKIILYRKRNIFNPSEK